MPQPAVSNGAEAFGGSPNPVYNLRWQFEAGSYDETTRTTQLDYRGSAHWVKYKASELGYTPPPGYSGEADPYILDLTLSDPRITISRDSAVLSAVVSSRDQMIAHSMWNVVVGGKKCSKSRRST